MLLLKTKVELYDIISFEINEVLVNIRADNFIYSKIYHDSNDELILELKYNKYNIDCKNLKE